MIWSVDHICKYYIAQKRRLCDAYRIRGKRRRKSLNLKKKRKEVSGRFLFSLFNSPMTDRNKTFQWIDFQLLTKVGRQEHKHWPEIKSIMSSQNTEQKLYSFLPFRETLPLVYRLQLCKRAKQYHFQCADADELHRAECSPEEKKKKMIRDTILFVPLHPKVLTCMINSNPLQAAYQANPVSFEENVP